MSDPVPTRRSRRPADHRPEQDPACAGCAQLVLLRALRRAGVPTDGRLSCEPGDGHALADLVRGGSRLVVLAGPDDPALPAHPGGIDAAARVERVAPEAMVAVEAAVLRAFRTPGTTVLLATGPCMIGAPRLPPLTIHEDRCNRCGACLGLGCPAISDQGGEAMVIDEAVCSGCGRCTKLCRAEAIRPGLRIVGG